MVVSCSGGVSPGVGRLERDGKSKRRMHIDISMKGKDGNLLIDPLQEEHLWSTYSSPRGPYSRQCTINRWMFPPVNKPQKVRPGFRKEEQSIKTSHIPHHPSLAPGPRSTVDFDLLSLAHSRFGSPRNSLLVKAGAAVAPTS